MMLGERMEPQPEVIRAILLDGSPCCGVSHQRATRLELELVNLRAAARPKRCHAGGMNRAGIVSSVPCALSAQEKWTEIRAHEKGRATKEMTGG